MRHSISGDYLTVEDALDGNMDISAHPAAVQNILQSLLNGSQRGLDIDAASLVAQDCCELLVRGNDRAVGQLRQAKVPGLL